MHAKSAPQPTAVSPRYKAVNAPPTRNVIHGPSTIEPCPECGKTDFVSNAERGRHRRAKHGVLGSSPTAKQRERMRQAEKGVGLNSTINPEAVSRTREFAFGYAVGYIASVIDIYSRRADCPPVEFTQHVFVILHQREPGGPVSGWWSP